MKQAEVEVKVEQKSDFPHLSLNLLLTLVDFISILLDNLFTVHSRPSQAGVSPIGASHMALLAQPRADLFLRSAVE